MENKEIEARIKEEILSLLKKHSLGINRRIRYQDYTIAKRIIFEGKFINSDIYDEQIGWICEYLKI